jgi:type IV pilus assembly protein PilM
VRQQPNLCLPAAVNLIQQMIRTGSFVGRDVITALPREVVQVKNLRLPNMPANELEAAVQFEARNVFPFETDHAQVRFLHAGEVRHGSDARQEVIVLAVKESDVNDFLEQLHRCGVVVSSLDFEPAALYRSVERFIRRKADEQEVNVLVDIGIRGTQVVIGRGRDISFYKPIELGGLQLQEAVARKLGISQQETRALRRRLIDSGDAAVDVNAPRRDPVRQAVYDATRSTIEEIAREISLCLRYYSVTFRGQRPAALRLTGGEACDPNVTAMLSAALPVPVEAARPLFSVDSTRLKASDRRGNLSEWAVALGLGLKHVQQTFGPRNGKKRDSSAPRDDVRSAGAAEVVDLTRAMAASGAQSGATERPAPQEVLRA